MCVVYDQIHEAWVEGRLLALSPLEEHLSSCESCQNTLKLVCPETGLLALAKRFELSFVIYEVIVKHVQICIDCEEAQNNPPPCQGRWPD